MLCHMRCLCGRLSKRHFRAHLHHLESRDDVFGAMAPHLRTFRAESDNTFAEWPTPDSPFRGIGFSRAITYDAGRWDK